MLPKLRPQFDGQASSLNLELNANEAPIFTINNTNVIRDENTTNVLDVTAIDPDGDTLTFTLANGLGSDNAVFSITDEGTLSFNNAPDFENPIDNDFNNIYSVGVEVSDGIISTTQLIQVTVNDVDETPINNPPNNVNLTNIITGLVENIDTTGGIKIADIIIDDDGIGTNQLSLTGSDASEFTIFNDNELFYIGSSPNFEIKNSYSVTE